MPHPSRSGRLRRLLAVVATDVTPLRVARDYRLLWSGMTISTIGRQITVVALPYQVFLLTRSSLAVGAIGLVQLVPLVVLSLMGGAIADQFDRRRLLVITNSCLAGCSALLTVGAFLHWQSVAFLYVIAGLSAAFAAVDGPARSAIIPNLVRPEHLASALALNFGGFQTGTREPVLRSVRFGLAYTARQPVLLGSFAADLVAMIFGMRRALYPVLATTVYNAGPVGLGLLSSAPGVGGLLAALASGWVGRSRALGRIVVIVVGVWGLSVIGLGLAPALWVALLALAVGGAADAFSAVARSTIMQTITPDNLRGRISAVYMMVVVGGPSLGDIEAGAVASAFSPEISIVSGGVMCLVGLGLVALRAPQLVRFRARYFTEARQPEAGSTPAEL